MCVIILNRNLDIFYQEGSTRKGAWTQITFGLLCERKKKKQDTVRPETEMLQKVGIEIKKGK